ncbi:hypothetical protein DY000_02034368 [Brassica cretica]|uniref:Uncharacterized protein n=1 Tax=Brassica cretica TaxID=69181 RepID=A0ABQ7DK51_BRACR|nr:hypothetical protein DY000_02034368 [Brassica cretica]
MRGVRLERERHHMSRRVNTIVESGEESRSSIPFDSAERESPSMLSREIEKSERQNERDERERQKRENDQNANTCLKRHGSCVP